MSSGRRGEKDFLEWWRQPSTERRARSRRLKVNIFFAVMAKPVQGVAVEHRSAGQLKSALFGSRCSMLLVKWRTLTFTVIWKSLLAFSLGFPPPPTFRYYCVFESIATRQLEIIDGDRSTWRPLLASPGVNPVAVVARKACRRAALSCAVTDFPLRFPLFVFDRRTQPLRAKVAQRDTQPN